MINLKKKLSLLFLIHLFLFDYVKYWSNKNLKMFIIDIKVFNMIKKIIFIYSIFVLFK